MKIAIDGPAGSGKSTVAKYISKKMNFSYIDTGAMYRGIAYLILRNKLSLTDKTAIIKLVDNCLFSFDDFGLSINGINCEKEIRTNEISNHVSAVAALPFVREILVKKQREIAAQSKNTVLDGRDIGTVVLPDADVKIYLETSLKERVRRRQKELFEKGESIDEATLEKQIAKRDQMDMNRAVGPLKKADDAIVVITDHLTIEAVGEEIIGKVGMK